MPRQHTASHAAHRPAQPPEQLRLQLENEALHAEVAHLRSLLALTQPPATPEHARPALAGRMGAGAGQLALRQAMLSRTRTAQLEAQVLWLEAALKARHGFLSIPVMPCVAGTPPRTLSCALCGV